MTSWCNGSPGFVHLWTLAHAMLSDERYRTLAIQAAWNTWESEELTANLCCGLAGYAYALLNLYQHTGETIWLKRAQVCAHRAALNTQMYGSVANSLYKGEMGIAVLAAELHYPETASLPFFERER